jgi:hypothetical protein
LQEYCDDHLDLIRAVTDLKRAKTQYEKRLEAVWRLVPRDNAPYVMEQIELILRDSVEHPKPHFAFKINTIDKAEVVPHLRGMTSIKFLQLINAACGNLKIPYVYRNIHFDSYQQVIEGPLASRLRSI